MDDLVKKIDGFDFTYNDLSVEGKENIPYNVLLINKKTLFKKSIEYAKLNDIDKIDVDVDISEQDFQVLKNIPLKGLVIRDTVKKIDINCLNEIITLEYLSIEAEVKGKLDLKLLKNMCYLSYSADKLEVLNIDCAKNLKEFTVFNYSEKCLPDFKDSNIENIEIYNAKIESLDSLKNCRTVNKVVLENCPKLSSINGLELSSLSLKELALRNCKLFSDYEIIGKFYNLDDIYLLNCNSIIDTSIFMNLRNLKYGNIDINIENGDVELLIKMPIIFKNYKHFNQKNNLKINITKEGNYLVRGKEILYKLN